MQLEEAGSGKGPGPMGEVGQGGMEGRQNSLGEEWNRGRQGEGVGGFVVGGLGR